MRDLLGTACWVAIGLSVSLIIERLTGTRARGGERFLLAVGWPLLVLLAVVHLSLQAAAWLRWRGERRWP